MRFADVARIALLTGSLIGAAPPAVAEWMTPDEVRRELVGVPLCGTPPIGPLAGKALCTVHLPDGTAVLAGAGMVARGFWEIDAGRMCRRDLNDPPDRRRCIDYERIGYERYRNSDGVEICLGPCPRP